MQIKGSIRKIGRRITEIDDNLRIEDIHEVEISPSEEQQRLETAELVKQFLMQEQQPVQQVLIKDLGIRPYRRSHLFHIVYDRFSPADVCLWLYVGDV